MPYEPSSPSALVTIAVTVPLTASQRKTLSDPRPAT